MNQKELFTLYYNLTGKTTHIPKSEPDVDSLTTFQISRVQQYQMREL
jgi:hypothetical protein